ncbi:hypothetical protein RI543_001440 [Arxiozyma heterogenica]|uniref:ABC transporter domain-containing protein n=1 Tax=Arxiozyma heterogenica TaxID=278026 RepID=A0AAN7ZYF9_9SACH|nr:hypothetical protein RI543_001440 [Kazachstania heterogenica]
MSTVRLTETNLKDKEEKTTNDNSLVAPDIITNIKQRINKLYDSDYSFAPALNDPFDYPHGYKPTENDKCPPCFNCMLPMFECKQFSRCNEYNGRCECIEGFGGDDCSLPLCGSLEDRNEKRPNRSNITNTCDCKQGWGGINCNVCEMDSVCDSFMPDESLKGTCYKDGMVVNKVYQTCNVTNTKILDILNGKLPQVSFSCDKSTQSCNFQFWIDQVESFYCGLDSCIFQYDLKNNVTHYSCSNAYCKCVPGTMLCGANGSIDIGEFLTEEVTGPGQFTCSLTDRNCKFNEPAMDDLILQIFGDSQIDLSCRSGECLHYSEIPGYKSPADKINDTWQGKLVLALTSVGVVFLAMITILYISKSPLFREKFDNDNSNNRYGYIKLPVNGENSDIDRENFLRNDKSSTLTFENISYKVTSLSNNQKEQSILTGISGMVKPGEIMAIMGGSGAGKTTLLDILAMKTKIGKLSGNIKLNGHLINRKDYKDMIGFVDQDDFLLPTLTVYETVLNSALLRLPRFMTFDQKRQRVLRVLEELRIMDIKDRLIGNDFTRGISGGEKRRVSIACELVTSPIILFLDEPTSGLDASNANNVIDCLVRLTQLYNRTIVLTIHQPRSNIFNKFNKLVLLSQGEMVYSGDTIRINEFLYNCGYKIPSNYNIADYLIDITFDKSPREGGSEHSINDLERNINIPEIQINSTQIQSTMSRSHSSSEELRLQEEWEHYATHRDELRSILQDDTDNLNHEVNENLRLSRTISEHLHVIFQNGPLFQELINDIASLSPRSMELPSLRTTEIRASFYQQLIILSSRSFKNTYRNPRLLMANYLLAVLLGLFLGMIYYNVTNDISGFQNRMGLFFFILTYFGFITFTGLSSFAMERLIFLKERSNSYYLPSAYYISKIISDILPLRIIPPIIITIIVYPLVGLNMMETSMIWKLRSLILKEKKYGLNIEIPGATILSTFGFQIQNFSFDIKMLLLFNALFILLGYLALRLIVVEKR